MVPYFAHLDACLLFDLAAHGFLNGLTLIHEPRQGRVRACPRQPAPTLPEQTALAIGHHHNGNGIGAGEMLGLTCRALAYLAPSTWDAPLAAYAAELMASMPVKLGPALGQNAGFCRAERRSSGT